MIKPKNRQVEFAHFNYQKALIEKYFPCFVCTLRNNNLRCTGYITPSEGFETYTLQIDYKNGSTPKVKVLSPNVAYDHNAHMYKDSSLCLFHPKETPWRKIYNIHETIIPWIAEWLVFYELYKIYGVWIGPEAEHGEIEAEK